MTETIDKAEAERHRAKMAKRKAVQDAEVAEKTIEKGLLIVHTGTGKGKSTAAFGLALRMLGRGHRIGVVQFIKGAWHIGRARRARPLRRSGRLAHDGRGLHLGHAGPRARYRGRRARLGEGARTDGRSELLPRHSRRAQHCAALRLSRSRRRGCRARRAPARACTSSSPAATPSRSLLPPPISSPR